MTGPAPRGNSFVQPAMCSRASPSIAAALALATAELELRVSGAAAVHIY
jgi:hypothetical protein